ncbi:MAG: FAD-binding protein [Dehalococcoidia bacterium]|nr:FAD-binding protein [Dehalococcoidia bacterium]
MPKNLKGKDIADIIPDKCIGCQICIGECPTKAIEMVGGVAKIDPELCIGCGKCVDVCPANCILFEKPRKKKAAVAQKPALAEYKGVAVFVETHDGRAADVSWELMGKARELAEKLGVQVLGFLPGVSTEAIAKEAIAYGCDVVYVMDNPLLKMYLPKVYGKALVQLCNEVKPEIVLIGATPLGRDVSSVVATIIETGLTADCTGLDIDKEQRLLMMTRPTFGGNIMATILCRNHRPQMSTVRPMVMKMPKKDPARRGEIRMVEFEGYTDPLPSIIDFIPRASDVGEVDIARVPVLVVIGKGACNSQYFPMLEGLAHLLGGTVACSRPVVQAGFLPYVRQVGQTGKTVAPKLYIGVAVSGAVQHLVGMQGSERIIAINTDRHAPMMQIADYPIIGDYAQVVPQLIEGIKARVPTLKAGSAKL